VHQSIGMKGIVLFGSEEQKERFLPDLAAGRKLAAFALTEPEAGSDAYHLRSRAVEQADGSWLLNGEKRYIVAPQLLRVGDTVLSGPEAEIKPGNAMPLRSIPLGTFVYNVEMTPGKGGQIARGAGTYCQVMAKEGDGAVLRLPSGEMRKVSAECACTIGQVGNEEHQNIVVGKAGKTRWLGRRPNVRGVAMNPVDHPMGGGEGKSSGGRHPCSPWGQIAKGLKTRKRKLSDSLILRRRKK